MTTEQLRQAYNTRPFQPLDLHLADSRVLSVEHPEQLAFSHSGRTIAVARPDDTIATVDLRVVVSLKPHPNGSSRHGRRRP